MTVYPAHVRYVVEEPEGPGDAVRIAASTLSEPVNAVLVAGGALATAVVAIGYLRTRPFGQDLAALRSTLDSYRDLLPWLLRISLGMPLIGAGFRGYYFSPAVGIQARIALVGAGFLLLFGLATRVVAGLALLGYLLAIPAYPDILLANEYIGGLLAIILLGSGRPSADHVFDRIAGTPGTVYGRIDPVRGIASAFRERVDPLRAYLPTLVRVTLGVNFLYLGISQKLLQPTWAIAVVEKYNLTTVVPVDPELWVIGAGLAETAVGAALLAGLFTRAASGVAFGLFTTTLFALPDDPVLAHLSLFGLVSVLIVTGGGPLSMDRRLLGAEREDGADGGWERPSGAD
jgi:uncharacterized membrane protein YphA (DoxX/SURF4 family)